MVKQCTDKKSWWMPLEVGGLCRQTSSSVHGPYSFLERSHVTWGQKRSKSESKRDNSTRNAQMNLTYAIHLPICVDKKPLCLLCRSKCCLRLMEVILWKPSKHENYKTWFVQCSSCVVFYKKHQCWYVGQGVIFGLKEVKLIITHFVWNCHNMML